MLIKECVFEQATYRRRTY